MPGGVEVLFLFRAPIFTPKNTQNDYKNVGNRFSIILTKDQIQVENKTKDPIYG